MKHKRILKASVLIIIIIALMAAFPVARAEAADSTSTAGIVSTASGSLNVRSEPSTGGALLTKLQNGTYVTLMGKSGSWWQVEYGAYKYGYVSAAYIRSVSGTHSADVTSAYLNVRAGAGASYSIKNVLQNGQTVVVLSTGNGWSRILYNGTQTGYVSSKYISGSPDSPMAWPAPASRTINQYFVAGSHQGIDIDSAVQGVAGDQIVAACSGNVVYSGWLTGYGYVVYINSSVNGQYVQTRCAHLRSAPLVSAGDSVYEGQKIGMMGNTGTSSGVHTHFEVRIRNSSGDCLSNADSRAVDPLNYVPH